MNLIEQEMSTQRWIDIPEPILDVYATWRPSPLYRAKAFEEALGCPVKIYYKNEGVSPAGSPKPNTAVAQARGITGRASRALNFGRMSVAGLPTQALPVSRFLDAAARAIVDAHRAALPDLSGVTVLLPSLHAAPAFGRALARAAGSRVLLLPRLATLPDWAAGVPVAGRLVADSEREAQLYAALAERKWFPDADRWHVAAELRELADELTLHRVLLPQSESDLVSRLEDAYQAKAGEPLQFEARLVHEEGLKALMEEANKIRKILN